MQCGQASDRESRGQAGVLNPLWRRSFSAIQGGFGTLRTTRRRNAENVVVSAWCWPTVGYSRLQVRHILWVPSLLGSPIKCATSEVMLLSAVFVFHHEEVVFMHIWMLMIMKKWIQRIWTHGRWWALQCYSPEALGCNEWEFLCIDKLTFKGDCTVYVIICKCFPAVIQMFSL